MAPLRGLEPLTSNLENLRSNPDELQGHHEHYYIYYFMVVNY